MVTGTPMMDHPFAKEKTEKVVDRLTNPRTSVSSAATLSVHSEKKPAKVTKGLKSSVDLVRK